MPIKNLSLTKIWRVWLKNWVCHALLNFKIKMVLAGSVFELHPGNFVKIHIFQISTNDSKTIFCWLCWYRIWKKDDPVLRPGVKESMTYVIGGCKLNAATVWLWWVSMVQLASFKLGTEKLWHKKLCHFCPSNMQSCKMVKTLL